MKFNFEKKKERKKEREEREERERKKKEGGSFDLKLIYFPASRQDANCWRRQLERSANNSNNLLASPDAVNSKKKLLPLESETINCN